MNVDRTIQELEDLIRYCEVEKNTDGLVSARGVIRRTRNALKHVSTSRSTERNKSRRLGKRALNLQAIVGKADGSVRGSLRMACDSYLREGLVVVVDGAYQLPAAPKPLAPDSPEAAAWRAGAEWVLQQAIEVTQEIESKKSGPQSPGWCRRLIGEIRLFKYNPFKKWEGMVHPPRY